MFGQHLAKPPLHRRGKRPRSPAEHRHRLTPNAARVLVRMGACPGSADQLIGGSPSDRNQVMRRILSLTQWIYRRACLETPAPAGDLTRPLADGLARAIMGSRARSPHARALASAHLAQDVCRRSVPASNRRCARCPAQHCAASVQRAVAGDGVRTWRDHDRVAAAGTDRNVTANAGTRQGHGPGPGARQPWCRAADAVKVTGQGALGGRLPGARRREARQAYGSQGQAQGDSHFPWTRCACRRFQEHPGQPATGGYFPTGL